MTAVFICPKCDHSQEVPPSFVGKKARCPKCGATAFPTANLASAVAVPDDVMIAPPEPEMSPAVSARPSTTPATQPEPYPAMRLISNLWTALGVMAFCVAGVSMLACFKLPVSECLALAFASTIVGVFAFSAGECIKIVLDCERHLRTIAAR